MIDKLLTFFLNPEKNCLKDGRWRFKHTWHPIEITEDEPMALGCGGGGAIVTANGAEHFRTGKSTGRETFSDFSHEFTKRHYQAKNIFPTGAFVLRRFRGRVFGCIPTFRSSVEDGDFCFGFCRFPDRGFYRLADRANRIRRRTVPGGVTVRMGIKSSVQKSDQGEDCG